MSYIFQHADKVNENYKEAVACNNNPQDDQNKDVGLGPGKE